MESTIDQPAAETGMGHLRPEGVPPNAEAAEPRLRPACFHCGEPCPNDTIHREEKHFCCQGCLIVHDLLAEAGLDHFYELNRHPGVRIRQGVPRGKWACLDTPEVSTKILDFDDGNVARVTLRIPAIHCVACVWLLENLFRLHPGIGRCQVNFPRREVAIAFAPARLKLGGLIELLASIGYEPQLTLGELEQRKPDHSRRKQWLRVGLAGFAFGNIMLLSLPIYLGLDSLSGARFKALFGYLSLGLALPVLVYSAADYWRSAWLAARQRIITLDVPIALGLAALYLQSAYEILTGAGEGYLDSLSGLIFFLLCGRIFQQKAFDRIAFDLDYRSFFPLSVSRKGPAGEENVALSGLRVGDCLVLRHGEIIPADGRLVSGDALIDYSFVTGESEPVPRAPGDHLYAGGKVSGGSLEVKMVKPVSQSYLTSLWGHEAFHKRRGDDLDTMTNRYGRRFTKLVIIIAVAAAVFWCVSGDLGRGLKAFVSVLIVACPCALALAAPFTLGTAQRWLARAGIFLKNTLVLERIARVNAIVFDKTGTLANSGAEAVTFRAAPDGAAPLTGAKAPNSELSEAEQAWAVALARHSTHPLSRRIAASLTVRVAWPDLASFTEVPGLGIAGAINGHRLLLGSAAWLAQNHVAVTDFGANGSHAHLAIDGSWRGVFCVGNTLRPRAAEMICALGERYELALLSGDNAQERDAFRALFGSHARVRFNQSPLDKLGFIRDLQESHRRVMMVGDGLNDAGALKQSDVGMAVVDQTGTFSPASDVILPAARVASVGQVLELARRAVKVVRLSFGLSAVYNAAGISIAAAGALSPVICAVLMPVSSVTVVVFACAGAAWAARKVGFSLSSEGT